jgi:Tfp pilus assembly protein FimT
MLATIAIIAIMSGISYFAFTNILPTIRSDSAMQDLEVQIRLARDTSVRLRRNVLVTFQGIDEIVIVIQNLDLSTSPLTDYFLPYGMVYTVFAGVPDTPDAYGNTNALNFNCTSALPSPCTITFRSDGSVLDSASGPVNGTVFIGQMGQPITARAVTIFGATGRIRGYRYNGSVPCTTTPYCWF